MRIGPWLLLLALTISACSKNTDIIPGNEPPDYDGVPIVKIQNFVNRLFIDLLAREPLDDEMATEVKNLQDNKLSTAARLDLVIRLQTDTKFIEGDTSYQRAYYQNLYNLAKIRCMEGASDGEILGDAGIYRFAAIVDSLNGHWEGYVRNTREEEKLRSVVEGRIDLEVGEITFEQLFTRMINNAIYDRINMNTVNMVNASFDNLLWRYPTNAELLIGFNMIELNKPGVLFGKQGANKDDYVQILTSSNEMFEGMIVWAYRQLVARSPSSQETAAILKDFPQHKDIRKIQQIILVTDEYANF